MRKEYVNELIKDIKKYEGVSADSVFIGGGTPTVLGDGLIDVINAIQDSFDLTENCEFSVEANPGTVDLKLLKKMRNAKVNRLSLGIQSFSDNELEALGRIHTAQDARDAFYMAREAGFDNINTDIMLSTPHQTKESVENTLEEVLKLSPEHVSAYSLIIEEGTPFYDMDLPLPDEDDERDIYHRAVDVFENANLKRYEISNFAKSGRECEHNKKYWTGKEYIGIGAAASSYCDNYRFTNTSDIKAYINGKREVEREFVDETEREKERFLLGLRMSRGVKYSGEFEDKIEKLTKDGLVQIVDGYVRLTEKGFDLGNIVFMEFV